MECIDINQNDYTAADLKTASEKVLTCFCFLSGDNVNSKGGGQNSGTQGQNSENDPKNYCTKYQDTESETVQNSVYAGILLAVINLVIKFGYNYFRDFYRFASLRTRNVVLFLQIYLSIVFFTLVLPLLIFAGQFSEPTRDFYIAISPIYSLWIIATLALLPIEKFSYWIFTSCRR
jgi:hypothetical protein